MQKTNRIIAFLSSSFLADLYRRISHLKSIRKDTNTLMRKAPLIWSRKKSIDLRNVYPNQERYIRETPINRETPLILVNHAQAHKLRKYLHNHLVKIKYSSYPSFQKSANPYLGNHPNLLNRKIGKIFPKILI